MGKKIGAGTTGTETQDVKNKEIGLRYGSIGALEKATGDDIKVYGLNALLYILHEFSHYGDKETNGGKASGQTSKDEQRGDLDEGKQGEVIASDGYFGFGKSPSGHRGMDVEEFMITGVFTWNGENAIAPIRGGAKDGTLDDKEKSKIQSSRFYQQWADLLKSLGIVQN